MKYRLKRENNRVTITVLGDKNKKVREITPARSQKIWNHSPDGFEWGYGGSGPAQTALAILLDVTDNSPLSVRLHQRFKWEFISGLNHKGGEIELSEIQEWLTKKGGDVNGSVEDE